MPGTSTEQVLDKGIRQKSIHSFHSIHSFPDGSAFCPGAPKRVPRTPRNTGVYTRHPTFVTATSGVLTRLPAWLSKNRMLSDMRSEKKLRVYTASEAKGLTTKLKKPFNFHDATKSFWKFRLSMLYLPFNIQTYQLTRVTNLFQNKYSKINLVSFAWR